MKNITYLDNDTLPECVYKNKQNILAIIDEIAKTYGLDFKGEYNSAETYNKNNVVVYDNKTYVYISTVTTSNILPTNTQFWALWIDPKPGAQGEKGEPGEKGENGGEVTSVVKISTVENVDTYRMTFSNGYTSDFTVTNGKDGQNGQNGQNGKGIESITLVSSTETSSTYRISYGDDLTFDFTVQNGVSPTITIGNVTTVDSTENARVENSGTDSNVVLNFYLPKGEKGDTGVSVNAEVVSEQTADDAQKVYSVGFINGILGNFTGQINSIYSDLAKKLELSESSEFITGTVSEDSTVLSFNVPINSGVYALWSPHYIGCIFSTYLNTTGTVIDNFPVINYSQNDYERTTSAVTKAKFYTITGNLNKNTNILTIQEQFLFFTVESNSWSSGYSLLSSGKYKLIKLN